MSFEGHFVDETCLNGFVEEEEHNRPVHMIFCLLCKDGFTRPSNLKRHYGSNRHQEILAKLSAAGALPEGGHPDVYKTASQLPKPSKAMKEGDGRRTVNTMMMGYTVAPAPAPEVVVPAHVEPQVMPVQVPVPAPTLAPVPSHAITAAAAAAAVSGFGMDGLHDMAELSGPILSILQGGSSILLGLSAEMPSSHRPAAALPLFSSGKRTLSNPPLLAPSDHDLGADISSLAPVAEPAAGGWEAFFDDEEISTSCASSVAASPAGPVGVGADLVPFTPLNASKKRRLSVGLWPGSVLHPESLNLE